MEIKRVTDTAFKRYGRVVEHVDFSLVLAKLTDTPLSKEVIYEHSVAELEKLPVKSELERVLYGGMPIQIGYCNGHNTKLNALEYHRSSEINVAARNAVLLVGHVEDIEEDFTYDTEKVEAFLVPAGTAVEIYGTTLHYAPCDVNNNGFKMAIILPKGTNYPLKERCGESSALNENNLLVAVNKWLIGHKDGGLDEGVFLGLKGKNIDLNE